MPVQVRGQLSGLTLSTERLVARAGSKCLYPLSPPGVQSGSLHLEDTTHRSLKELSSLFILFCFVVVVVCLFSGFVFFFFETGFSV